MIGQARRQYLSWSESKQAEGRVECSSGQVRPEVLEEPSRVNACRYDVNRGMRYGTSLRTPGSGPPTVRYLLPPDPFHLCSESLGGPSLQRHSRDLEEQASSVTRRSS